MAPRSPPPRRLLRHLLRAFALCAALALSCAEDFEKQSFISKLRVLAVQFEPAELIADPNAEPPKTRMTALAVDPAGNPVGLRWALCTVQDPVPSPSIDCPGTQGFDLPVDNDGAGTLDFGKEPFRTVYNQVLAGQGGIPADQVKAQLAIGVPLIIGFSARAGTQQFLGLTTVTIRSPDGARPLNHNPAIATLMAGSAPVANDGSTQVPPGGTTQLTPIPADGSHEPTDAGPEKLNYSFYATGGEVKTLRSTDTTATGQAADPSIEYVAPIAAGPVQLYVVVRDGRGGIGWLARSVQVR